jgi:transposase
MGLVASVNRPGGNVTGVSLLAADLETKRIGLLREIAPKTAIVGALMDRTDPSVYPETERSQRELQAGSRSLGVSIDFVTVGDDRDLDTAFNTLVRKRIDALVVAASSFFNNNRDRLKQFPAYLNRWDSQQARNEGVFGIDSPFMGALMPKAYSRDLRERVITAVETGASRREAAERFEVSVASAVKWLQRWYQQRSAAPKPRGGSISPLEEFSGEILDLIARQPDLTLVETVAELRKRRIKTSRSSLWRFLDRHNITLKKSPASSRTAASRCGAGAPPVDTRARYA